MDSEAILINQSCLDLTLDREVQGRQIWRSCELTKYDHFPMKICITVSMLCRNECAIVSSEFQCECVRNVKCSL